VLKIHETIARSGAVAITSLDVRDGVIVLVDDEGVFPLPEGAIEAVMKRYGAPFAPEEVAPIVGEIALGEGDLLRHVRHLAGYDVIAKDYLVHLTARTEPLCALATTVAGALSHLARAASRSGAV